jgi:hypothetical protein
MQLCSSKNQRKDSGNYSLTKPETDRKFNVDKQFKDKKKPSDPNLNRKRIEKQHYTSIQIFQSKETASTIQRSINIDQ